MNTTVVFWYDRPPKVEKGAFNVFTKLWVGESYYVFYFDSKQERKNAHWDDDDFGNAKIVTLYDKSNIFQFVSDFINKHQDSIHILNGYNTPIVRLIKPLLFKTGSKALLFTERPAIVGGLFEKTIRRIYLKYKYSNLVREYRPFVNAILPLGMQGVKRFESYGLNDNEIYNFMYCPPLENLSLKRNLAYHQPVKFLYVGRFYYKTKGTDVLMKATKYLKGEWHLDMVGGYGKDAEEVKSQIEKDSHIDYIGIWDSHQVVENMQDYDVVIVPSKADGWNLIVNEAIHAGIAVITSDQAVSHEVIEKCNGGLVYNSGNPKALALQMQKLIDKPEMICDYMQNNRQFVNKISDKTVGRYFYDIVMYEFYGIGNRPTCPWR